MPENGCLGAPMKVLLTGATGLLDNTLLNLLLARGQEVRCLVLKDSPNAAQLDPMRRR
jgi:thioester reductase-like protein